VGRDGAEGEQRDKREQQFDGEGETAHWSRQTRAVLTRIQTQHHAACKWYIGRFRRFLERCRHGAAPSAI
jgi:hypothetical protein